MCEILGGLNLAWVVGSCNASVNVGNTRLFVVEPVVLILFSGCKPSRPARKIASSSSIRALAWLESASGSIGNSGCSRSSIYVIT